ncbi:MAG: HAD family hydrolase [Phormidesmis sp. RL_2_1]|nr:HAD family hydrolase [Phormidesmis sp. RL_2_1]
MDGTLTESRHDFPAISRALGLPENEPILEALNRLPPEQFAQCHRQLADIEIDIARQATPQPGAPELLSDLLSQNKHIGILTRNTKDIARTTLAACGLADFFCADNIVGRSCCRPKPHPDGIFKLLAAWSAAATDAVMTGDHPFDLLTGRNAHTATVYLAPNDLAANDLAPGYLASDDHFPAQAHADYIVQSLHHLRKLNRPPHN